MTPSITSAPRSVADAGPSLAASLRKWARSRDPAPASPIAAGGKIYFSSELGQVFVVKPGRSYELLATNSFGEVLMASGAISGDVLYFHTRHHLIAVADVPLTK